MKKLLRNFAILLMSVVICSCSNSSGSKGTDEDANKENPISHLKSVTKEIAKKGNKWDEKKMKEVYKDILGSAIDYFEGMPSEEEIEKFDEVAKKLDDAIESLDEEAQETFNDLKESPEIGKLLEKLYKNRKKAERAIVEDEDSDDE